MLHMHYCYLFDNNSNVSMIRCFTQHYIIIILT